MDNKIAKFLNRVGQKIPDLEKTGLVAALREKLSLLSNKELLDLEQSLIVPEHGLHYPDNQIWPIPLLKDDDNIYEKDRLTIPVEIIERPGIVEIDDPTPGFQLSYRLPAREFWKIDTISLRMVTSATVNNREMKIEGRDADGVQLWSTTYGYRHVANKTVDYTFSNGMTFRNPGADTPTKVQFDLPFNCYIPEHGYLITNVYLFTGIIDPDAITNVRVTRRLVHD